MRHYLKPPYHREAACGCRGSTIVLTPSVDRVECRSCLQWIVRAGQTAEGKLRAAEEDGR